METPLNIISLLPCQFLIDVAFGDQGAFLKNPTAWGRICRAMTAYDVSSDLSASRTFLIPHCKCPWTPEKLFIALRAVGFSSFEGRRDTIAHTPNANTGSVRNNEGPNSEIAPGSIKIQMNLLFNLLICYE
jgi:hypothetical protein